MKSVALVLALLAATLAVAADQSMQGRLEVRDGSAAVLQAQGRAVPLVSARRSVAATLQDTRISGKELKVIGRPTSDGAFEVEEFYVVRPDGSLYRLVYFCSTCNITRFAPGRCDCCQQPTVPTEIPLSDPRVAR